MGSTSPLPTRLGECEKATAGVAFSVEHTLGFWDSGGASTGADGYKNDALVGMIGLGYRPNRSWQVLASLPARSAVVEAGSSREQGGGLGDATATVLWDPIEEKAADAGFFAATPQLGLGLRAPTGRDWTASQSPMLADVTGLEHGAVLASVWLERSTVAWPWSLGLQGAVSPTAPGWAPMATLRASLGRYLGGKWTASAVGAVVVSQAEAATADQRTRQTTVGGQLVRGQPRRWRAWVGGSTQPDIGGLGRSSPRLATVTTGLVKVW